MAAARAAAERPKTAPPAAGVKRGLSVHKGPTSNAANVAANSVDVAHRVANKPTAPVEKKKRTLMNPKQAWDDSTVHA
jgi:hypothetical protein